MGNDTASLRAAADDNGATADQLDSFADSMFVQLRINADDCDWLHSVAAALRNASVRES